MMAPALIEAVQECRLVRGGAQTALSDHQRHHNLGSRGLCLWPSGQALIEYWYAYSVCASLFITHKHGNGGLLSAATPTDTCTATPGDRVE